MSVVEELRRAMKYISENDIKLGNDMMEVTFDKEFCEYIGGYPKDAVLWFKHDGNHYDLVVSMIEDNKYDFTEHPEYVDGIHWRWAVKERTKCSGYPMISQSACTRPFDNSITIGKSSGSSIISDIYVPDRDKMLYCTGRMVFTFNDQSDLPTTQSVEMLGGRLNGTVPFCGLQAFLCVSNLSPSEGGSGFHDLARGKQPNLSGYIYNLPTIRYKVSEGVYSTINFTDGMFNVFNSSGTATETFVSKDFLPYDKDAVCYYPIFSNSMRVRTIMVPVRKGQYVYLGMFTQSLYSVTNLDIDLRAYDYANFDGSVNK